MHLLCNFINKYNGRTALSILNNWSDPYNLCFICGINTQFGHVNKNLNNNNTHLFRNHRIDDAIIYEYHVDRHLIIKSNDFNLHRIGKIISTEIVKTMAEILMVIWGMVCLFGWVFYSLINLLMRVFIKD